MSEFHDEYSESLDAEFRKLEDALLSDEVGLLAPASRSACPGCLRRRGGHADGGQPPGRRRDRGPGWALIGIFTERDLLTRVVRQGRERRPDPAREVMTVDPEALTPTTDLLRHQPHAQCRLPHRALVDADHRPIGVVTVNDVWGGGARVPGGHPEPATRRPGEAPAQMDSG